MEIINIIYFILPDNFSAVNISEGHFVEAEFYEWLHIFPKAKINVSNTLIFIKMLDRCTVIELFNWKSIFKSCLVLNIIVPGVLVHCIKMSSWHLEGELAQKQLYLLLSLCSSPTLEQTHTTSSEGIGYHLVFCNPKTWAKTKRLPKYLGSTLCQVQHFGENWTKVFWLFFFSLSF